MTLNYNLFKILFLNKLLVLLLIINRNVAFSQIMPQSDSLKKLPYQFFYFKKGLVEQGQGNYSVAILDYTIFMDDNKNLPPYPKAFYQRANAYKMIKDYKRAIIDFEKLHSLRNDADGATGVGQCFAALQNPEKAILWFRKGLERAPLSAVLQNELGMQYCVKSEFSAGVRAFHSAIKNDSTFAIAYNNIGAATYFDQDVDSPERADVLQAKTWFDKALHYDKNLALAWKNRGAVNFFLKNYTAAKSDLQEALRLNKFDAQAHLYLGITDAALKNEAEAYDELQEAVRIKPDLEIAYEELGHLAAQGKKWTQALAAYDLALRAANTKAKQYQGLIWYYKGLIYSSLENEKQVKTALQSAKKSGVFADRAVYSAFIQQPLLKKYQQKDWLQTLYRQLEKGQKETKFGNIQLKWFKMRQGAAQKVSR